MMISIVGPTSLGAGLFLMALLPAHGTVGARVCVGPDRVLRQQAGERCQPTEREYLLADVDPVMGETAADQGERAIADLQRRVAVLTQRIATLEHTPSAPPGHRVKAPFSVVDAAGKPIFEVIGQPRAFHLKTASGHVLAYASATETGGSFRARSFDGGTEAVLGVNGNAGMVFVRKGGITRGTLGIAENGKPSLEITNDAGVSVAALLPGASGGGKLQLGNAAGNSMVEAGVLASGVGLVRTFPFGNPGAGLLGMPGTFIMGRSGR